MQILEKMFDAVDARLCRGDWAGLMHDLASLFEANLVTVYAVRAVANSDRPVEYTFLGSTNPEATDRYVAQQVYNSQFASEFKLAEMRPMLRSELVPDDVYRATPYYRDFAGRYGFWWMTGSQFLLSHDCVASLILARSESKADFSEEDIQRVTLLCRYLRVFITAALLERDAFRFSPPVDPARFSGTPAVHVSSDFRILGFNLEFQQIVTGDMTDSSVTICIPDIGDDIRDLFSILSENDAPGFHGNGQDYFPKREFLVTARCDEPRPMIVHAVSIRSRLHSSGSDNDSNSALWLFFRDSVHERISDFSATFGLTEAEKEILDMLARGMSIRAIAERTGRTYGTSRWHVQNILSKTQVGSQKMLIASLYQQAYPL